MQTNLKIEDGIAELSFSKPPVNALQPADMRALTEALADAAGREDARVILLRGEGRGYCAGIDIKALAAQPALIPDFNRAGFDLFAAIHHCPLPVVSAVHGYALGAGAAMLGASDVVFLAEGTQVGLPEIKVGMLGGASHLLRILPLARVRSMYLTGDPVDAEELFRLGAVEAVVPQSRLRDLAYAFAARVAAHSRVGLRFAKEAMNGVEPVSLEKNYRYEQGFTFEISFLDEGQGPRSRFAGGGAGEKA